MNISATPSIMLKPAFKSDSTEKNYGEITSVTDKIEDKFVSAKDIKSPILIVSSVLLAGVTAFHGVKSALKIITKNHPDFAEKLINKLKTSSDLIKQKADKLQQTDSEKPIGKIKKIAGKVLEKVEKTSRNTAGKITAGIEEHTKKQILENIKTEKIAELTKEKSQDFVEVSQDISEKLKQEINEKAQKFINENKEKILEESKYTISRITADKSLQNIGGAIGSVAIVTGVSVADFNDDGVPDIAQRSQNVYKNTKDCCKGLISASGIITEAIELIS